MCHLSRKLSHQNGAACSASSLLGFQMQGRACAQNSNAKHTPCFLGFFFPLHPQGKSPLVPSLPFASALSRVEANHFLQVQTFPSFVSFQGTKMSAIQLV